MKQLDTYDLQFSGLSIGNHVFNWSLEQSFFQDFNAEEILDAHVQIELSLEKKERLMELNFSIAGKIKTHCDRCGDELWNQIDSNQDLLVRFSNETDLTGDEVIFLDTSEYKLDLEGYFYEFSYLALPVKRIHPEGECNELAEEFLSEYPEANSLEEEDENEIDPRWEALKKLK